MAKAKKIRIKLKAYDNKMIDASAEKIVLAAKNWCPYRWPVPLPTEKQVYTLLRAVHKYKDAREQLRLELTNV